MTRLLLGRLLWGRRNGRPRLLLSAQHVQNLLRGLRPRVGLVWTRLLLLVRGICACYVGLSRLSGLGLCLIVGVFVGVFLIILFPGCGTMTCWLNG